MIRSFIKFKLTLDMKVFLKYNFYCQIMVNNGASSYGDVYMDATCPNIPQLQCVPWSERDLPAVWGCWSERERCWSECVRFTSCMGLLVRVCKIYQLCGVAGRGWRGGGREGRNVVRKTLQHQRVAGSQVKQVWERENCNTWMSDPHSHACH